ncbi:MAG: RluA family pseudouridine synthase [Betaproteobacteria bacterium]|nr:RluA family pseudouridine synthase [Betaproteobacteria bacterium]
MKDLSKVAALLVDADSGEQRIDNFLMRHCKGVPRSHIYRILRTGEVRVNSGRVDATYRVKPGDKVRVPPIRIAEPSVRAPAPVLTLPILYEDPQFLAVDKPTGIAVHGGSGISFGVIERLRASRPELSFLELVHRLDRETSGVLLLAKKRSALTALHALLREGRTEKHYTTLVKGKWRDAKRTVNLPLHKYVNGAGERRVSVKTEGRESVTIFRKQRATGPYTLLSAELRTGRTHQIRVHLAHLGFPIAGDVKYGDFEWNRELVKQGLKRMFLHAARFSFEHPALGTRLTLDSPLPQALSAFVARLDSSDGDHASI